MATTLEQLLQQSAAYLDLDTTTPTSTELSTRVSFANQAVKEWEAAYQWRQLKVDLVTSGACLASLAVPSGFKNLLAPIREYLSSGVRYDYPEIPVEERYTKNAEDRYCYIVGDPVNGYAFNFNNLPANATLGIPYQRQASLMATLSDVCEVPDPEFVKTKITSYVLQSRNDERFPLVDSEAKRILKNMIGREMIRVPGGYTGTPRAERYRIGE